MTFSTIDIETRQRLGQECEQVLLQLEYVFDSIDAGLVVLDLEGKVLAMNKVALALHEFENNDQARRPLSEYRELFDFSDLKGTALPFERWPLTQSGLPGKLSGYEVQVQRKPNGRLWVGSFSGAPVQNKAGEVISLIFTVRDITVKRRTEQALGVATANMNQITNTVPVRVIRCNKDRRYLWVSEEYAKWLGSHQEEIVGRPLEEIIGKDAYQTILPHVDRVLTGQRVCFETRINYRGFGTRWINATYMPTYDSDGRVDGWFGVVFDTTDKKDLEKELRRSKQALEKRISRAVDDLRQKDELLLIQGRHALMGETIGQIAHQWRQPLNTLALLAQDLKTTCRKEGCSQEYLDASLSKSLVTIYQLSKIIDDFRYFLKPCIDVEEFGVREVLGKTLSLLEATLDAHKIRTEVRLAGDPVLRGCPTQFSQVILNLINNALDAFAAGAVADPVVAIESYSGRGKTVMTVTDNAGGIPNNIINKIFDPYFTTKASRHGTGIGLFMCKSIINKNLNGSISVRNVNAGAEFRIEI